MTYQEIKWIVNEIERLNSEYSKYHFDEYYKVIPEIIYKSDIDKMNVEEIKEILNSHYGVYQVGDIVFDKSGSPALITFIDSDDADRIQDVKYHIVYPHGETRIACIEDLISKCGNTTAFKQIEDVINSVSNKTK